MATATGIMEREVLLQDLIDRETFTQVCNGLRDMYHCSFRVFGRDGRPIIASVIEGDGVTPDTLLWLLAESIDRRGHALVHSPAGGDYVIFRLTAHGDEIGRMFMGPLSPEAAPVAQRQREEKALAGIRRVVESIVFLGLKTYLTSGLHLELMDDAHRELENKNRALLHSLERMQELARLKTSFLQTVSHELKSPLTAIIGYAEVMLEGLSGAINDEQRNYLATILQRGESLLAMINNVLDITRMVSGFDDLSVARHSPAEIIALVTEAHDEEATRAGIHFETVVEDDLPDMYVDIERIGRALSAVIGNAIKFSPGGGTVSIRAMRRNRPRTDEDNSPFGAALHDEIVFEVQDHGIGIPASAKDRIFDSFFQVEQSTARRFEGAGLGLTIARNFVECHRGRIEVDSKEGVGTTMRMVFPTTTVTTAPRPRSEAHASAA